MPLLPSQAQPLPASLHEAQKEILRLRETENDLRRENENLRAFVIAVRAAFLEHKQEIENGN